MPEGTLWRLDVPHTGEALESGSVRYARVPEGTSQRFPDSGSPVRLTGGDTYYLYVSRDVFQPITRCTFVAS